MSMHRVAACLLSAAIAAVTLPRAPRAEVYPPLPCEEVDSSAFRDVFTGSRISVIDVGDVVKEKGNNVCSVLIDTSLDKRVQVFFTTGRSVSGRPVWRQVSVRIVPN